MGEVTEPAPLTEDQQQQKGEKDPRSSRLSKRHRCSGQRFQLYHLHGYWDRQDNRQHLLNGLLHQEVLK